MAGDSPQMSWPIIRNVAVAHYLYLAIDFPNAFRSEIYFTPYLDFPSSFSCSSNDVINLCF